MFSYFIDIFVKWHQKYLENLVKNDGIEHIINVIELNY